MKTTNLKLLLSSCQETPNQAPQSDIFGRKKSLNVCRFSASANKALIKLFKHSETFHPTPRCTWHHTRVCVCSRLLTTRESLLPCIDAPLTRGQTRCTSDLGQWPSSNVPTIYHSTVRDVMTEHWKNAMQWFSAFQFALTLTSYLLLYITIEKS